MKREQLKTILLILLVSSSMFLTLAIWNHQPEFEMSGIDQNLVDPEIETGYRLTRSDLLKPIYMVYHDQSTEEKTGLASKSAESRLFDRVSDYYLYNFTSFNLDETWWEEHNDRLEIVFSTDLPSETIYDLFSVDQSTVIPSGEYNRIEIIFDHEGHHLIFRNDLENRVIGASLQNYPEEIDRIETIFSSEDLIRFEVYQSSRGTNMYLPDYLDPNVLLFSYRDLPIDPFKNFLFTTPSIVRSSRTPTGDTIFIDGTRELTHKSNYISFTNQTNQQRISDENLTCYELLGQVHDFVNTHNGYTFEPPFSYFISKLEMTPQTNQVEFSLSYNGIPIFSDSQLATISVAWHNQIVYQYRHPLITLIEQRGIGREMTNLISANEVIQILNGESYQRTAIYDVTVGYRVREQLGGQGQVFELIPTWYVKGINGWSPLVIPSEGIGGDNNAMGPN
ncbi:MAG TPA: hypothetical protein GXZ58_05240 [Bacilli bacterium]|nr:hypothetical protein [Bacilli bacterium]